MESLDFNNPIAIKLFKEIIQEMIRQEARNLPYNRMISAKVITADNVAKTADIQIFEDGTTIANVNNKSGETLSTNDEIYLELINGSSSNFYIALKK